MFTDPIKVLEVSLDCDIIGFRKKTKIGVSMNQLPPALAGGIGMNVNWLYPKNWSFLAKAIKTCEFSFLQLKLEAIDDLEVKQTEYFK
jgi:hypothetical protein